MEDFANNAVRDIAVQCAAQSAKTQTVMNCACWAIAEDPGPAMWVTATKDELRDFLRDRLTPTFETCRPVKERIVATCRRVGKVRQIEIADLMVSANYFTAGCAEALVLGISKD